MQSDRLVYSRLAKAFQISLQKFQPVQQVISSVHYTSVGVYVMCKHFYAFTGTVCVLVYICIVYLCGKL